MYTFVIVYQVIPLCLVYLNSLGLVNVSDFENMVCSYYVLLLFVIVNSVNSNASKRRQRRYLIFPPSTQYGVFATVSIPLPDPDNYVSVAWFLEANYYNVANGTWFQPLLGDVGEIGDISRSRNKRDREQIFTRSYIYTLIENMLENQGYDGEECLLRTICDTATSQHTHNGILGDAFHLIFTPSSSLHEEDLKDIYYEAEYNGLDGVCEQYWRKCPKSPLQHLSMNIDHLI